MNATNRRNFIKGSAFMLGAAATAPVQASTAFRAETASVQDAKRKALAGLKELGPTFSDFKIRRHPTLSGKHAAFYIDDVIFVFRDLARDRPKSCWDHPFLAHLKEAYEKYGLKTQLNLFYRNDFFYGARGAEFTLKDMPDIWKDEFQSARAWLRFGFHSYSEFPDYPWINASYDDTLFVWQRLSEEVMRFAGPGMFALAVTPHWGPMSKDGCLALRDAGAKVIWVSRGRRWAYSGDRGVLPYGHGFRVENARKPETAIYWREASGDDISISACGYNHLLDSEVLKTKGTFNVVHDRTTKINFKAFTSGGPLLNLWPLADIVPCFEKAHEPEFFCFATHEQYFYKDYLAYQSDYRAKTLAAAKWIADHNYNYLFIEDTVA